ncbi:MAG: glycosyltransferase family 2 protein [Acidimicrobiia bacterium]|nr:glycosyltransferase family 2 protein [Acidimicrobiia bacterium]MDH5236913.1 glycosyltransferase family 2 protein [Acidimicrobiia bacterium]
MRSSPATVDTAAPRVSVVLPVLNEQDCIAEALARLQDQTWHDLEILVADGGSTDATRSIVAAVGLVDPRVRLVDNPRRLQSAGLNETLRAARGQVLVRVDGHSFVERDYVERCVELLEETGAAVVGGRMVAQPGDTAVGRGVALANEASWGAGPARFHREAAAGPAETVYLGTFRRSVVERVGGWAEDVGVNEDYELNHRIRAAGETVWFDPALSVGYRPRASLRAVAVQYFRYGRSKATVMRRHPDSVRARQVVPTLFVPLAAIAVVPGPLRILARVVLGAHAAVVVGAASRTDASLPVRACGAGAAWVMHWAWSAGFWFGLAAPFRPAAQYQTRPPS